MQQFPQDFIFGVSTGAYQIEGAWNEDGRGENFWDRLIHSNPTVVREKGSNADIACDFYHKYKEDVQLIKSIGFSAFKFSISWSRVLPDGVVWNVNKKGIDFYNNLINELIENNITPVVCLYHFDLPQKLQDIGGWCNPLIVNYFEDYARLMFHEFGDRVKWWASLNEPTEEAHGYVDRRYAPFLQLENLDGHYIVIHNMLKAHARAYRVYEREFKPKQEGKMSIILAAWYYAPKTDSEEDKNAAYRAQQFTTGWCAHPIFSEDGDYPPIMRKLLDQKSKVQEKPRSKLPIFTPEEVEELRGSYDFMAINHYTTALVSNNTSTKKDEEEKRTILKDAQVRIEFDEAWTGSHWSRLVPQGFREILRWIKKEYGNPPVYVTENGVPDEGGTEDTNRINFHNAYLMYLLKAINEDGCNVIAYHVWSLLDNFEWLAGYRYGIVSVDFESRDRKRTPKQSVEFFRNLCETKSLDSTADQINAHWEEFYSNQPKSFNCCCNSE